MWEQEKEKKKEVMFINIRKRFVVNMQYLSRLVLRYIYDKKHMSPADVGLMERSIVFWAKNINITEIEQERLERIGWLLRENAEGRLERRKELFKKHSINFMKFHKMPNFDKKIMEPYVNVN